MSASNRERVSSYGLDDLELIAVHCVVNLLRGSVKLYYGDELQLAEPEPYMKWDNTVGCGFSNNNQTKLTSCDNNLAEKIAHGADKNLIHIYNKLALLKSEPSFAWGDIKLDKNINSNVFAFTREALGFDKYLVAFNKLNEKTIFNFQNIFDVPSVGKLVYSFNHGDSEEYNFGTQVSVDNIFLHGHQFIVVKFTKN